MSLTLLNYSFRDGSQSITYSCGGCGYLIPSNKLQSSYYCRECQTLKCFLCVTQKIHSLYCPQCLEITKTMSTSSSALMSSTLLSPLANLQTFKHRCKKCIFCPECSNSSVQLKGRTDPLDSKGSIYFYCTFCKWRSSEESLVEDNATKLYATVFNREKDTKANAELGRIIKNLRIKNEKVKIRPSDQKKILKSIDDVKSRLEVQECVKKFDVDAIPSPTIDLNCTSYECSNQRTNRHLLFERGSKSGSVIERTPLLSVTQKQCKECNNELVIYETNELENMDKSTPFTLSKRESATRYAPHISFAIKRIFLLGRKFPIAKLGHHNEISVKLINPYATTIKVLLTVDKDLSTMEVDVDTIECIIEPHPPPDLNDITYEWDGEVDPRIFYKQKGFVLLSFKALLKSINDKVVFNMKVQYDSPNFTDQEHQLMTRINIGLENVYVPDKK